MQKGINCVKLSIHSKTYAHLAPCSWSLKKAMKAGINSSVATTHVTQVYSMKSKKNCACQELAIKEVGIGICILITHIKQC